MWPKAASTTSKTLTGKAALVGGSSFGIGATMARELSRRGAHVIINYPFPAKKGRAEEVLCSLLGVARSIIVEADFSTLTGPQLLAAAAAAEFRKIDILVNNTGIGAFSPLDTPDDADRGTLLLTRACLKYLSQEGSRIINICSSTSRDPISHTTIYAGSKGMIERFTRCWARKLPHKYWCTVNSIASGPVAVGQMLSWPQEFLESLRANFDRAPFAPKSSWRNGVYLPVTDGSTIC
ncbi:3-oxoacyl-reductase [Zopfia rhizophila CBS 207.26]|uniref:3-oxoacyl-reductase n=1 Tax=Zopfia rhizophila CBS 207.26 TaxID=1314779 RepID=A0A6A6E9R3_9PEZI|nr:3-oxoacyl-reductase [Zopfia rhizophila CBS 207.26]